MRNVPAPITIASACARSSAMTCRSIAESMLTVLALLPPRAPNATTPSMVCTKFATHVRSGGGERHGRAVGLLDRGARLARRIARPHELGVRVALRRRSREHRHGRRACGRRARVPTASVTGRAGALGRRSSTRSSATRASSRARCIPRQTCGPCANARCSLAFARSISKRSGSGKVAGSRFAPVSETVTRSPRRIDAPASSTSRVA